FIGESFKSTILISISSDLLKYIRFISILYKYHDFPDPLPPIIAPLPKAFIFTTIFSPSSTLLPIYKGVPPSKSSFTISFISLILILFILPFVILVFTFFYIFPIHIHFH